MSKCEPEPFVVRTDQVMSLPSEPFIVLQAQSSNVTQKAFIPFTGVGVLQASVFPELLHQLRRLRPGERVGTKGCICAKSAVVAVVLNGILECFFIGARLEN